MNFFNHINFILSLRKWKFINNRSVCNASHILQLSWRWTIQSFGARCDMKLCGLYGFTNYKKASSVSLRNYRALFLRRNVRGGTPHFAYFTEIYSVAQKTWRCTGVLYYFAQCSFHATVLSSMQTADILMLVVNLGNSDWTVTWWKYYFYLTHISKFCILAFQFP